MENLQSELAQVKQKAVFDLDKERVEYRETDAASMQLYTQTQTNPYNTPPAVRWAATAQVPLAVAHHCTRIVIGSVRLQAMSTTYNPGVSERRTSVSRTKQHHDYACEEENQNKDSASA